jgi:adenylosuccinate lyase
MAYTHLQPAEPTTVGYRLAGYGLDLLIDLHELERLHAGVKGKGFKGAVGTSASYTQLLRQSGATAGQMEERAMAALGLDAFPVATQVYPRKQDWLVVNGLAGLAGSIYKLAFDLRILQSPAFGEWSEPWGRLQVGSSAMPFKRNPINAENMDSLARLVAMLPRVAWDNAAHSLLERTLDDKANRRLILPQAFLIADELLAKSTRLVQGLAIDDAAVAHNLAVYAPFAATERLLMELVRAGADRQAMHEVIRGQSLAAWDAIRRGEPNPLTARLAVDTDVLSFLPAVEVRALMQVDDYIGDASERALAMAREIRTAVQ